jgi:acyl-CoA synthetase (AMP-forming)/AMP-acid ligase II
VAEIKESLPSPPLFLCVGSAPSWALSFERLIETSPAAPPIADLTGEDWHSIYLTSGTTGDPKMIVLTQANWLAVVRNHLIETYRHTEPTDVYLHAAPMTHASGSLVMAHLARGARQHVLHKFSPEAVLDSVDREGVTATWLSPTMLGMVLDYYQGRPCDFSKVKSLRYGAAPMMAHRLEQAVDQWGPIVCGAWGQWEAPQQCTFFSQQQIGDAAKGRDRVRLTSVGLPMLYSKVAAADEQGTILPPGTSGEIVVSGDHIMLGYLGDPEATGKLRFGEWQRTGDLGHVDHEGFVYITGRRRELIISGGVKVPPRQLEETIITHPEIADVAVVGIPDFKWGETIHAAVVLRAAGAVSEKELLEWFAAQFSKGLRPRSVQFFDALPRNEFGKVMRPELVNAYIKSRGAASDLHAQ